MMQPRIARKRNAIALNHLVSLLVPVLVLVGQAAAAQVANSKPADSGSAARGGAKAATEPDATQPDRQSPNIRLSEWERGIRFESIGQPNMAMYVWFYEWNMFQAVQTGEYTHNDFHRFSHHVASDGKTAEIRSEDMVLKARPVHDGAELELTVTNRSDHDWPDVAGIIPCFNPGPPADRNPQFPNAKTYFIGPDGPTKQLNREIHFNADLLAQIKGRSDHGAFAFSKKWPISDINAKAGLLLRESTDGHWVAGIAWERFLSAQAHNPWDCMHLGVRVGPLKQGESRTIRGRIYLFKGDRHACLSRYREDFGPSVVR